jgi:hypothetical protein
MLASFLGVLPILTYEHFLKDKFLEVDFLDQNNHIKILTHLIRLPCINDV